VPEKKPFILPIHSVEAAGIVCLLILVYIAFDDLQTISAEDTHNTPHHDLDAHQLAC